MELYVDYPFCEILTHRFVAGAKLTAHLEAGCAGALIVCLAAAVWLARSGAIRRLLRQGLQRAAAAVHAVAGAQRRNSVA